MSSSTSPMLASPLPGQEQKERPLVPEPVPVDFLSTHSCNSPSSQAQGAGIPAAEPEEASPLAPITRSSEVQMQRFLQQSQRSLGAQLPARTELEGPGQKNWQDDHEVPEMSCCMEPAPDTNSCPGIHSRKAAVHTRLIQGNPRAGVPKQGCLRFFFPLRLEWDSHE